MGQCLSKAICSTINSIQNFDIAKTKVVTWSMDIIAQVGKAL